MSWKPAAAQGLNGETYYKIRVEGEWFRASSLTEASDQTQEILKAGQGNYIGVEEVRLGKYDVRIRAGEMREVQE